MRFDENMRSLFFRLLRFGTVGGLAATVNFGAMFVLVEPLGFGSSPLLMNIANGLAMVVGVVTAFLLHRAWTWSDVRRKSGRALLKQFASFAASASIGMILRIGLFGFCHYFFSIPYLFNVALGMLAAAIVDFILYDRLVFSRKKHESDIA